MAMHTRRRLRALLITVAIGLALQAPALRADTYPRQPGVDAEHYVFRLTLLTGDSNEIEGDATVRLRITAPGVHEVFLDLTSATPDGKGMTVSRVRVGDHTVPFTHEANRLRIALPQGTESGDEVSFDVQYHGTPVDGLHLVNNIHGDRCAFSDNWYHNARQWLPTIDHIADKATGEFIVTTRAEYQVIANGRLAEQLDLPDGLRRTHWVQNEPIAPWLYSLGVARFIIRYDPPVRGTTLSYWAFPQDVDKGLAALERDARGAFDFFSERVGPFVYDKLAHVEAAGMGGGTEYASEIFYGEKGVASGNAPVVHETAHQWFGDSVTENDWNDIWLSEGFATYFTLLYTEHAKGRDAFVEGLRRSRDTVLRLERSLPNTPVVHPNFNEAGPTAPNNRLVYEKGGWTLHMLRDQVGTDAFWRGIREYYAAHVNGTASTDDFRRAMEHASGQDLGWFFRQWLTRSGEPALAGSWRYDAAAKKVVVTVKQTQASEPYRLRLGVGVVAAEGALPRVTEADVTGREATIEIPADARPVSVVFDPDVWLLATIAQPQPGR